MPVVKGKHFSYTKSGIAKAKKFAKKLGVKIGRKKTKKK